MSDPLAGKREAINRGELNSLTWPDQGKGAPVAVGDGFQLRSCSIEITKLERTRSGKGWFYVAHFSRSFPDRTLPPAVRGVTSGIEIDHDQLEANEGRRPPEPEQVPNHVVRTLPASVAAQARFASVRHAVERERKVAQLAKKIRNLEKQAQRHGVDVTLEIDHIAQEIDRVERLVTQGKAAA